MAYTNISFEATRRGEAKNLRVISIKGEVLDKAFGGTWVAREFKQQARLTRLHLDAISEGVSVEESNNIQREEEEYEGCHDHTGEARATSTFTFVAVRVGVRAGSTTMVSTVVTGTIRRGV
mmetsp:Transcript_8148/g.16449  ORF Transcript_8148/g.16449 Transcript_8148/m.16449 type:complete len:121 (+) Transcript_8148:767-1129(+)